LAEYAIANRIDNEAACSRIYTPNGINERLLGSFSLTSAVQSAGRKVRTTPEELSRLFHIGLETARRTLQATTQLAVRSAIHPITRRYKTDLVRGLEARRMPGRWYSDTYFSKYKSLTGNTCGQIFTDTRYIGTYPLTTKAHAGHALSDFTHDVGVPAEMIIDNSLEQTAPGSAFMKLTKQMHISTKTTEPYSPWQNSAEDAIRELKRRWKRTRRRTGCSPRLWDYGHMYEARIMSRIARGHEGRTGYEQATGITPDISEDLDFEFYDPVFYFSKPNTGENPRIRRWLGPSRRVGGSLCYWILSRTANPVSTSSVQIINKEEIQDNRTLQERLRAFDEEVKELMKDEAHTLAPSEDNGFFVKDLNDEDDDIEFLDKDSEIPKADEYIPDAFDQYIGARLFLPKRGERIPVRVTKRMKDAAGRPIGIKSNTGL